MLNVLVVRILSSSTACMCSLCMFAGPSGRVRAASAECLKSLHGNDSFWTAKHFYDFDGLTSSNGGAEITAAAPLSNLCPIHTRYFHSFPASASHALRAERISGDERGESVPAKALGSQVKYVTIVNGTRTCASACAACTSQNK